LSADIGSTVDTTKRIALDLDGVVYNYSATACFLLNTYKGYNLDWEQTSSWGWLQAQVKNNDWQWLWSGGVKEGLFRYGSLIKGAAEGVKELAKMGKIVVVTSRPTNAVQDTLDWLSFMKFPVSELHILSHGQNKAAIKPDVAIDDGPHNIKDYTDAGIPSIILSQLYNRDVKEGYRANDWSEVLLGVEHVLRKS
jgi:5'(3')-deoxyribonucleotidase